MKKFKIDFSAILFAVVELMLILDIVIAVCSKEVTLFSYICMVVIAMVGFLEAEIIRQRNRRK